MTRYTITIWSIRSNNISKVEKSHMIQLFYACSSLWRGKVEDSNLTGWIVCLIHGLHNIEAYAEYPANCMPGNWTFLASCITDQLPEKWTEPCLKHCIQFLLYIHACIPYVVSIFAAWLRLQKDCGLVTQNQTFCRKGDHLQIQINTTQLFFCKAMTYIYI